MIILVLEEVEYPGYRGWSGAIIDETAGETRRLGVTPRAASQVGSRDADADEAFVLRKMGRSDSVRKGRGNTHSQLHAKYLRISSSTGESDGKYPREEENVAMEQQSISASQLHVHH